MFSFLKKDSKTVKSIFPSAKEMAKRSTKNWPVVNSKAILDEINKQASLGKRYAVFHNSYIDEKTFVELRKKGYVVKVYTYCDAPFFRIMW